MAAPKPDNSNREGSGVWKFSRVGRIHSYYCRFGVHSSQALATEEIFFTGSAHRLKGIYMVVTLFMSTNPIVYHLFNSFSVGRRFLVGQPEVNLNVITDAQVTAIVLRGRLKHKD